MGYNVIKYVSESEGNVPMQKLNNIDGGKPFDWGQTSQDYAKYRDIYPEVFYQRILNWSFGGANEYIS